MIPAPFDYLAPRTLDEALRALADGGEDVKVLAGGQSLLPVLRLRMAAPSLLIDLGHIDELRGVREDQDSLTIGAMTTHYDIVRDPLVDAHTQLIALTTATVADAQIRHRGTFGGSLAHADPAGDLGAAVTALDGEMMIVGMDGERTVLASEFFVDLFTAAGDEPLLVDEAHHATIESQRYAAVTGLARRALRRDRIGQLPQRGGRRARCGLASGRRDRR